MKNHSCHFCRIPTLVCLVLILAVSFSCAFSWLYTPRFAFADTSYISIVSKDNAQASYHAYQFFTADIDEDNNATHITWGNGVDSSALIDFLNQYGYETWITDNSKGPADNAQSAAEFIALGISNSEGEQSPVWVNGDSFAYELGGWAVNESGLIPAYIESEEGLATYTDDEGYYLLVNSDVDALDLSATLPVWIPLGGSTHEVVVKAGSPSIDKAILENDEAIKSTDIEISDTVTYQITTTLPSHYHGFAHYFYQVSDAVPEGMTIETGDVAVSHNDTDITSQFDIAVSDANLLTVTAEDLKALSEEFASGDTITITYTVDLNNLGDMVFGGTGNINGASLEYSNDPYSDTHGTIEPDDTYVYTYQISIDKTDASTGVPLEGAQFIIQNAEGKYLAQSGDTYAWSADQAGATKFTTNAQGAIAQIPGLDAGTYTITEVQAPEGYADPSLSPSFTVDLEPTYSESGQLEGLVASVSQNALLSPTIAIDGVNPDSGMVNIDVTNEQNILDVLPKTWDTTPLIFKVALIAALICIASALVIIARNKMKAVDGRED